MKKMLSLVLALLCLLLPGAVTARQESFLYVPALDAMTYVEGGAFGEGYAESYITEDGLIFVEVLTLEGSTAGLIGEGTLEELLALRTEGGVQNMRDVACISVDGCAARRIRIESGSGEDACVVDATVIWADDKTYVCIVQIDADAWYGFAGDYGAGDVQAMIDRWIGEIQIGGHDQEGPGEAVLVTDRSCGRADGEELGLVVRYAAELGDTCDAGMLARALSELTGLDFLVNCYELDNGGLMVDWQAASTLVAGLDGRAQNEHFFFHDAVSLNWFMMDSLYWTIRESLGIEDIYYTMDGGQALRPAELGMLEELPTDIPYMGSAFYAAHSDVAGDEAGAEWLEANDYGDFDHYVETEFFRVGIPDEWEGLYRFELIRQEPFGYTAVFSEKDGGFVFSLEARWFDDETVQMESVWQGYLGRLEVERLGELDLLVTYAQPAPDAGEGWQIMYDGCREVVDTMLLQENVSLDMGEYMEYQP